MRQQWTFTPGQTNLPTLQLPGSFQVVSIIVDNPSGAFVRIDGSNTPLTVMPLTMGWSRIIGPTSAGLRVSWPATVAGYATSLTGDPITITLSSDPDVTNSNGVTFVAQLGPASKGLTILPFTYGEGQPATVTPSGSIPPMNSFTSDSRGILVYYDNPSPPPPTAYPTTGFTGAWHFATLGSGGSPDEGGNAVGNILRAVIAGNGTLVLNTSSVVPATPQQYDVYVDGALYEAGHPADDLLTIALSGQGVGDPDHIVELSGWQNVGGGGGSGMYYNGGTWTLSTDSPVVPTDAGVILAGLSVPATATVYEVTVSNLPGYTAGTWLLDVLSDGVLLVTQPITTTAPARWEPPNGLTPSGTVTLRLRGTATAYLYGSIVYRSVG